MTLGDRCVRCGARAEEFASILDDRLCHGDGPERSCYEIASGLTWQDPIEWEVQKVIWAATREHEAEEELFDVVARERSRQRHPSRQPPNG